MGAAAGRSGREADRVRRIRLKPTPAPTARANPITIIPIRFPELLEGVAVLGRGRLGVAKTIERAVAVG